MLYFGLGALVYFIARSAKKSRKQPRWQMPAEGGVFLNESTTPGASPTSSLQFQSHRDAHAKSKAQACRNCGKTVAVQDHFDETVGGVGYYVVTVACRACSARSRMYFNR